MISTSHTYESIDLFPTLLLKTNLGRNLSTKEKKVVEKSLTDCYKNEPQQVAVTLDHYVLNQTGLSKLKGEILQHVKKYFNHVYHPPEGTDVYLTQSWINVCLLGDRHHELHHSNSFISGVLYINTCDKDCIQFNSLRGRLHSIQVESTKWEKYNARSWNVSVSNLDLLLFPSTLQHHVPYKEHDGYRVSLSFNTFLKGTLGVSTSANELKL